MSSKTSERRNNLMEHPGDPAKKPQLHIFAANEESPLFQSLADALRGQPYKLHKDVQELRPIVEAPIRKVFVVFCTDGLSDSELNRVRVSEGKLVQVCTLGRRNVSTCANYQSAGEVVAAISEFSHERTNTIRLSSVHSISLSKGKKVDTARVATNATYDKLLYFKNYRGEYMPEDDALYENLVDELENYRIAEPFKSSRELEKKKAPVGKKKYLVLLSTNEASVRVVMELRRAKLKHFHYLLLGPLSPCEEFLEDSVLLASSNPAHHLDFLLKNGFDSDGLRKIIDNLKNAPADKPKREDLFHTFQGGSSKIVGVEGARGQEEEPEKKKIRKIKSPAKGKPSQISSPEPEHDQSTSSINNLNIVVSKHKDEPIQETEEFRTNKQGERIYKKDSVKEVDRPQHSTYEYGLSYAQSAYDAKAPVVESHFSAKKASNIESKYRNPSVIIQEMSDEYRGSNKESIMNLEPEKPKVEQGTINEPVEENTAKMVVNKSINYGNQPDTHYINSNRTLETRTNLATDPAINEIPTPNSLATIIANEKSPRIISGAPITITPINSVSANTRVYSSSYQSPSRVIRKEVTVPEEVVQPEQKPREENRLTFGSNFNVPTNPTSNAAANSSNNNALNYNSAASYSYNGYSNGGITVGSNYRNPQPATYSTTYSNYYTPQTFSIPSNNNEPYHSKIHVSPGKVEPLPLPKQPEEPKSYVPTHLSLPKVEEKATKQFIFNSDEYEQIERDGRIVYRKKMPVEPNKYTPLNYVTTKTEKEEDGSPSVRRYEVSPLRREAQATTTYSSTYDYGRTNPHITTYDYTRSNSPNVASTYEYARSNTPQIITYDYGRGNSPANYEHIRTANNNYSTKNYEVATVPYKADEHNLGEMIESSHKKKTEAEQLNRGSDGKNFVTVSYRADDRSGIGSAYKDTGVRVYGVSHPRVEVERLEQLEPRVSSAAPVVTPSKPKPEPAIKLSKPKQEAKGEPSPTLTPKNALNESNWFSRMSELHSDGSILRRNNIRFGVKLQKREERQENSVMQNKLASGIFKVNDLNKKMALNRIIQGQEYIEEEREKYAHINPSLNRFHLLLQEDLDYLHPTLAQYLAHPHDRIDSFAGVNSLFSLLKTHSDPFDLGFIFARQAEIALINPVLLPENYFLVSIEGEEGLLEINEAQRRVRVDQLRHFPLVQRIILDSQLFQYVAYRNSAPEVELLADKFVNSEFILEKIETEFTTEILDCYYYELPRLTRLYVLCDEAELPGLLGVVQAYAELNPGFRRETCKLVCVLSNILGNDHLIMAHPTVTFISNPEEVTHFRHILGYAHHYDAPDPSFLPQDHLFYHSNHAALEKQLTAHYPGRFAACPFEKVAEVYGKVERISKSSAKHGHRPRVYLVLHESVNAEKVRVECFTKIFMLGKAKVVQNKVVRVMNVQELLELLKK